jgi:PAS domain S-box-containing protein
MRRFIDLILDTTEANGALVDADYRHTWVHSNDPEPPADEILGKTDDELFADDVADPTMAVKREAIGTASRAESEFSFVKPWGQKRYRAAAEPVRDDDDEVTGAMFVATDLSEQYQLLDRTSDGVFTVDDDWTVTFWNERLVQQSGIQPAEIVGRNLWEVFGDNIPDELEAEYRSVMRTGEPAEIEQHLEDPFDYWLEIRVFADEDGLTIYTRNITERKEYERKIESQRDDLDVLNQVLRHDIRNDLQLVSAYAELLAERVDEDDRQHVETIRESATHAVELTKTAREIAEVFLGDSDRVERVDLRPVLDREVTDVRASYPSAALTVEGALPSVPVLADDLLGSVFRNVLKNAIQHNDAEVPTVTVSAVESDDTVLVRIADNGPGIPDSRKDDVFGKNEKGLESEGTGIGLYLVKTLVESYGGDVWVEDGDTGGAVFCIELATVVSG